MTIITFKSDTHMGYGITKIGSRIIDMNHGIIRVAYPVKMSVS